MTDSSENSVGPPLWLLAELTYECPLHCPYCSNPVDMTSRDQELSTDEWLRVLDEGRAMGAVQLGLSGGEPLLRKDLEVLVAHARALGYYTNLITSGIGLTEKRIAALKEAGLDHIQLSFQAANAEDNDLIGNKRHSFELKREVARLVKAYDYPMVLNFCLTAQNINQIDEVMALSCELQGDFVELATVQYYGWAYVNRNRLLPTQQQLRDAEDKVNRFRAAQAGKGPKFIFVTPDYYEERPKTCMNGWGSTFLTVTPDGTALPCHSARILPLAFPNVREHALRDIWYVDGGFNHFRGTDWMKSPCSSCEEKHKDLGGCRCQAFMLTGDMYAADPVCSKSPDHDRILEARERAGQAAASKWIYRDRKTLIALTPVE